MLIIFLAYNLLVLHQVVFLIKISPVIVDPWITKGNSDYLPRGRPIC